MPLRDHFRPPLDDLASWEWFYGGWPAMIVQALSRKLPRRYVTGPRVHFGTSVEIAGEMYEKDDPDFPSGVASVVWEPPEPTLVVAADWPAQDTYEVRVYDRKHGRRLVAAVEIVSPANKARPEHRRAFVAKCSALLQARVSITIIDLVTTFPFNLYRELLEFYRYGGPLPFPPAVPVCSGLSGDENGQCLVARSLGTPSHPWPAAADAAIVAGRQPRRAAGTGRDLRGDVPHSSHSLNRPGVPSPRAVADRRVRLAFTPATLLCAGVGRAPTYLPHVPRTVGSFHALGRG